MSPSNLEKRELEQDIEGLRSSIAALESSRSRLQDVAAASPGGSGASDTFWGDLEEVVEDFFEVAGEDLERRAEENEEDEEAERGGRESGAAFRKPRAGGAAKSLENAFSKLRHRVAADLRGESSVAAPVPELQGVIGELDAELSKLNAELETKLGLLSAIPDADDDTTVVTPVPDHTTVEPETDVVPPPTDVDVNVVIPDVDVVVPVVDVNVVIPDVDVIPSVTPQADDTPAYEAGQQTEIGELDGGIYDINQILASGKTVADLRRYDVPAGVVRDAGVSASAMITGGYTFSELHEAGYSAADLHGLAGATDLRDAGYSASELHGIFSVSDCIQAYSPHELHDAGFALAEFHGIVPLATLRDIFSLGELRSLYGAAELRDAGFHAAELNAAGFSWEDLAAAGFTLSELESAGANETALRGIFPSNFSASSDGDDDATQFHTY